MTTITKRMKVRSNNKTCYHQKDDNKSIITITKRMKVRSNNKTCYHQKDDKKSTISTVTVTKRMKVRLITKPVTTKRMIISQNKLKRSPSPKG